MWELLKLSLSNQHHNRNISHCCCISSVSLYHDNNENMCKTFVTVWLKTEHYFCHQCPVNLKLTEKKKHAANDAVFSWLANRWPTVLWIRHWLCVCVFFCCCFFVCLCWLFSPHTFLFHDFSDREALISSGLMTHTLLVSFQAQLLVSKALVVQR